MEQEYYISLLAKQFTGAISSEERIALTEWLQLSSGNRKIAEEFGLIWENSTEDNREYEIQSDVDADFADLMKQIKAVQQAEKGFNIWYKYAARAAAAVSLVLLSVWGFNSINRVPEQMIVADSGVKEVVLPDNSKVWLQQNAKITFPEKFNGATRNVKLEGRGYFEVKPNTAQHFCVSIPDKGTVEVLGTSFDINPGTDGVSVAVSAGKVKYILPGSSDKNEIVRAGNKLIYDKSTKEARIVAYTNTNELAWQRGGLVFDNVKLEQAFKDIEDYHHVHIQVENPALLNRVLTLSLTKASAADILKEMSEIITFELSNPSQGQFIVK